MDGIEVSGFGAARLQYNIFELQASAFTKANGSSEV